MPTKREFAQGLKAKYPQYASMDDEALANHVLAKYPVYQASITPDPTPVTESGGWGPAIARVATPLVGSLVGSAAGPLGTAAGGSGGAMLGETIAQFLEGKGYRPKQIAAQGIIGAIPIPGASVEAPLMKQVISQAVKGGALNMGATALSNLAEGQAPSVKDLSTSGAMGAIVGGAAHAVLAPRIQPKQNVLAPIPELEALNAARNATPTEPSLMDKAKGVGTNLIERFQNRLIKPDQATKELAAGVGRTFKPGESPFDQSRIAGGKGSGRAAQAVYPLKEAQSAAEQAGLGAEVRDYLDLVGMKAGMNTLLKRADTMENGAYVKGKDALLAAREQLPHLGESGFDVPPTSGEVQLIDKLKAQSEKGYTDAERLRNKVHGGQAFPEDLNPEKVSAALLEKEARLGTDTFNKVKALAQPVLDYNQATADRLREYGFISAGRHAELKTNEGYVPQLREIDAQVEHILSSGDPIHIPSPKGLKVLKGSDLATMDPLQASLIKRQIIEYEGARNKSVQAFTSFAKEDPSFAHFAIDITGNPSKLPKGYDVVEGWVDGAKHTWAMPTEIATPLKMLNPVNAGAIGATLKAAGGMFQRLATVANAGFSATNPIRDVMDIALLNPRTNITDAPRFVYDWLAIFGKNLRHDVQNWASDISGGKVSPIRNMEREQFLGSGAAYSTNQRNITPKMQLSLNGEGSMVDKIFRPIEALSANTEEASKMAVARLLERKGVTGNEALINIRDFGGSPDFAVRGNAAGAMNTLIPFFNASMQGIARNVKGISTMTPQRAMTLLAGASALEMVKDQWNSQFVDADGVPSLERMTDNDKQNYFTFITPNVDKDGHHTSIKLSKGHAARILFNPIADTIQAVKYGKGSTAQILGDEATQFMPGNTNFKSDHPVASAVQGAVSSLTPALKVPIEQAWNKNTFTGAPIEAKRLEGLPPGMRSTATTNPVFKRLGEDTNVSPSRIQHAVQAAIPGTVGELTTELANRAMGESKGSLFGSVTRRFTGSLTDQYKQNMERVFYDELKATDEVVQGLNKLKKSGDIATVRKYVADNEQALTRRTALTKLADRMGSLRNLPDEKANPLEMRALEQAMEILGRDTKVGKGNPEAKRYTKAEIDKLYSAYSRRTQ